MKAYKVTRCNIDGFTNWSETVVDVEEVGVEESIKKEVWVKVFIL